MNDVRHRYLNDPIFKMIVDYMRIIIQGASLAPSEVREAAMLACILEEERRPMTPITEEEMDRMRRVIYERRRSTGS